MKSRFVLSVVVLFCLLMAFASEAIAKRNDHSRHSAKAEVTEKAKKKDDKAKPFADLIKDRVVIEGLFTFYHDTVDNSMLMAIKPEQLGPIYLCGESRTQADGRFYDNGSMGRTFPFYLKRVAKKIMFMEKNLRVRVDSSSTMFGSVESGISDHLIASADIKSKPQDSAGTILIDPSSYFVRDAAHTGHYLGTNAKSGHSFDSKNSYFDLVKSFPENSEIDVKLHFKTKKPQSGTTLQSGFSFFHTYHYSLSSIPESDYIPRLADDRVGHFLTMYQDYNALDQETPYVRYIERWHLKKKYPDSAVSEPVEPIVYWIENTVPEEYRGAIAEGIEFWNPAFEKAGFRNAVTAKQMPDDADWDPADVRYNTVQWMIQPGGGYAVGPSRANPLSGQIFDADIRVSTDFIRFMFSNMEMWISPVSFDGMLPEGRELFEPESSPVLSDQHPHACNYASETAREAALGLAYLLSAGDLADKDAITKEYVHAYLVELVAHEVGHTLGLRHNFRASTIYSLEQLSDRLFTQEHGLTGSIMDYGPPNIHLPDQPQGEYYASIPGPYDFWVIEYAYSDFGATSPEEEQAQLSKIASRSAEPLLTYATDEDAFGRSMKSLDPMVNMHDLGDDPLRYAEHQVNLTRELWHNSINRFETDGQRYQKLYNVFQRGWRSYRTAAQVVPKYVGGLYHYRNHVGDPNAQLPFVPVPAAEQRRAVTFLSNKLFAANAFDLPWRLVNKLQQENLQDFSFSAYSVPQVDYPLHQSVLYIQNMALRNLYSRYVLGRLVNNLARVPDDADKYTMFDMFTDVRRSIWGELVGPKNVNSFRRQLQLVHLSRLMNIYLSSPSQYPADARTLAANDLDIILRAARKAVGSSRIDGMTKAHFGETIRQIVATQKAQREFTRR